MNALNIILNIDALVKQRTRVYTSKPRNRDEILSGWISFDELSLYGSDPSAFRRIAAMFNEAATAIEATNANSNAPAVPLRQETA
jgi:hypothetical protein